MKILSVTVNRRRKVFEVVTRVDQYDFPFAVATPTPTVNDNVLEAFVDDEMNREGFTYRLASGTEGAVHIDSVLEYNEDPAYLADLALYKLTLIAQDRFQASGLSARQLAKRLGTSPTQLYRLLDQTNYAKSARQVFAVLYALGCELTIEVSDRPSGA